MLQKLYLENKIISQQNIKTTTVKNTSVCLSVYSIAAIWRANLFVVGFP